MSTQQQRCYISFKELICIIRIMRRTSPTQFDMMVTFMEQHGDLNKPSANSSGRVQIYKHWAELCTLLNSDASGGEKTEEQWKKVWRDLKSNTKKKSARIHRAASGTGGGPPLSSKLTDVELRVLWIMGPEAATGLNEVTEAGFSQELAAPAPTSPTPAGFQMDSIIGEHSQAVEPEEIVSEEQAASPVATWMPIPAADVEISIAEWNEPGPSSAGLPASAPTPRPASVGQTTPRRRRLVPGRIRRSPRRQPRPTTAVERAEMAFRRSDEEWRNFLCENKRKEQETEQERLRLRAIELRLQEQWQNIAQRALDIIEKKL